MTQADRLADLIAKHVGEDGVHPTAVPKLTFIRASRPSEPLHTLHPALSRPGRCLADIEFAQLTLAEIERWCEKRGIDPPPASRSSLAELYAHVEGRATIQHRPSFGFADAA